MTLDKQMSQKLKDKHDAEVAELNRKLAVYKMLPEGEEPIVCNFNKTTPHEVSAWVSYHGPAYDPDKKFNPVAVLEALESAGWSLIPEASLIKWDTWRRSIEPSPLAVAQSHPHKSGYRFTDGDAVAPYWVTPNQFTKVEFAAFMLAPDGNVYRVSINAPLRAHISCRRVEYFGNWKFEGPASLDAPKEWPIHPHSRAFKDTEQGVSGAVYFHADKAHKTASAALAELLK